MLVLALVAECYCPHDAARTFRALSASNGTHHPAAGIGGPLTFYCDNSQLTTLKTELKKTPT